MIWRYYMHGEPIETKRSLSIQARGTSNVARRVYVTFPHYQQMKSVVIPSYDITEIEVKRLCPRGVRISDISSLNGDGNRHIYVLSTADS